MDNITKYRDKWFNFSEYQPHKGQMMLHNPPRNVRFTVACCGRRWGKSYASAREAELVVTQKNKNVWIVAPTYGTSERIFKMVWDSLIIKHRMPTRRKSLNDQFIEFEWGSTIQGKSAEHPTQLIGLGLDLVIFDEASKINLRNIWQMYIRPALSDRKGRAIFISTPHGFNSFHDLYKLSDTEEAWYSFNSPSWENHHAFPDGKNDADFMEAKRTLHRSVFDQEYNAMFTTMSGRVYDDFNRDDNVKPLNYDGLLPVYVSIDFGFRLPAVVFFVCYKTHETSDTWTIHVIDEIVHKPNLRVYDLADMIKAKKYRIAQVYGDPAGYQVQSSTGIGEIDLFYKATGWRVFALRDKASRSINSGISHVRNFVRAKDGTRRLFVTPKCKGLIEDFESYRYPEHKENRPLTNLPLKDGHSDHSLDALRYGVVNRFPIRQYSLVKKGR